MIYFGDHDPSVPWERYMLLYLVHKTLVLALEEFFVKVDETSTTLQL